nr:hypothetical protein Itr_chr14CG15320 [Ipomoea trifida]
MEGPLRHRRRRAREESRRLVLPSTVAAAIGRTPATDAHVDLRCRHRPEVAVDRKTATTASTSYQRTRGRETSPAVHRPPSPRRPGSTPIGD